MQMKAIQETITSLRQEAEQCGHAADALEEVLRGANGTFARAHGHKHTGAGRLSPEARRRIVAAQKARWARYRAAKVARATKRKPVKPPKPAKIHTLARKLHKAAARQLKLAHVPSKH